MYVFRPMHRDDCDALLRLASQSAAGLTSLPSDEHILRKRIEHSVESFACTVKKAGDEGYLFALEDSATKMVVGVSGIEAVVGVREPFYTYLIQDDLHESKALEMGQQHTTLHLTAIKKGPSEICSLLLSPKHRGNGRLLSLGRFLFMAAFPNRFSDHVIAELRGVIDDNGVPPFYTSLAKSFMNMPFTRADYLSMRNKEFIKKLMPSYPIYKRMLSTAAQAVIGHVHINTRPALHVLLDEGFKKIQCIDIFDGGPVVRATCTDIRSIQESQICTVQVKDDVPKSPHTHKWLIANESIDFRCVHAVAQHVAGKLVCTPACASALHVDTGAQVRVVGARVREEL